MFRPTITRPAALIGTGAVALALVLAGCGSDNSSGTAADTQSSAPAQDKQLEVAYLSFAVANSYDAPMLASAQAIAAASNAKLTVFDANNSPQTQFTQFQNAITSGKYDGIITQPILGTGLTSLVEQAVAKGIKVVNIDQVMGADYSTAEPQVKGLSANVIMVPTEIGTNMGKQVVAACASKKLDPCNVGYLYDIKASTLDVAINKAFTQAIAGTPVKVVAEGEDFFTPAGGLKASQDMLQAHSDLSLIVGSDQGIEGAVQALDAAGKTGKVLLVGYGGSAAGVSGVASGAWFSDVAQVPASTGQLGMQAMVKAIRDGQDSGAVDPAADLPNNGIVTKDTASQFTAEWPG